MEYQLITPNIKNKNLTAIQRVLTNRGIALADIEHYLNTTEDDILDPSLLDNMREGATMLIKHISANNPIMIQTDPDCDGFTASALLINYLNKIFPTFVQNNLSYRLQDGKEHGIIPAYVPNNIKLVIAPDSSSNSVEECAELAARGIDVLILDHHESDNPPSTACVINNQLCDYPTKSLAGVGVVYKFCSYLDKLLNTSYVEDLVDLVALGCIADMVSLQDFETAHLIRKGINKVKNPFFKAMVEKQAFSLKDGLTPFGIAFYIAPYINATIRVGTQDEKLILFESMLETLAEDKIPSTKRGAKGEMETRVEQACRNCMNIKNRQTKIRDANLETIKLLIQTQNLLENKILTVLLTKEMAIDKNLTGLIANQLMAEYQKPVLLLNHHEREDGIFYEGSARNVGNTKFESFREYMDGNKYVEYAAGHASAFGTSIAEKDIEDFIELSNKDLNKYDFSPCYKVDFILSGGNIDIEDLGELAALQDIWGQQVEEPLIAIENITITSDNIKLMSADKNPTLKFIMPNGISLIKFKSSQEEYQSLIEQDSIVINVVGKLKENNWNGNISIQMLVEDYEVVPANAYWNSYVF